MVLLPLLVCASTSPSSLLAPLADRTAWAGEIAQRRAHYVAAEDELRLSGILSGAGQVLESVGEMDNSLAIGAPFQCLFRRKLQITECSCVVMRALKMQRQLRCASRLASLPRPLECQSHLPVNSRAAPS